MRMYVDVIDGDAILIVLATLVLVAFDFCRHSIESEMGVPIEMHIRIVIRRRNSATAGR